MSTPLMERVYDEYYACPHGCSATYHIYSLTLREMECKDCRKMFKVPSEVKIKKPSYNKPRKKVHNG